MCSSSTPSSRGTSVRSATRRFALGPSPRTRIPRIPTASAPRMSATGLSADHPHLPAQIPIGGSNPAASVPVPAVDAEFQVGEHPSVDLGVGLLHAEVRRTVHRAHIRREPQVFHDSGQLRRRLPRRPAPAPPTTRPPDGPRGVSTCTARCAASGPAQTCCSPRLGVKLELGRGARCAVRAPGVSGGKREAAASQGSSKGSSQDEKRRRRRTNFPKPGGSVFTGSS